MVRQKDKRQNKSETSEVMPNLLHHSCVEHIQAYYSHDLSMRSGAGHHNQKQLPVESWHVIVIFGLPCGLLEGSLVHFGTPHGVSGRLVI